MKFLKRLHVSQYAFRAAKPLKDPYYKSSEKNYRVFIDLSNL